MVTNTVKHQMGHGFFGLGHHTTDYTYLMSPHVFNGQFNTSFLFTTTENGWLVSYVP